MWRFIRHQNRYHQIIDFDTTGVRIYSQSYLSLAEIWDTPDYELNLSKTSATTMERRNWQELQTPLPSEHLSCWAYGLTYSDHRGEVGIAEPLVFKKNAAPEFQWGPVPYRPYLDFELEVGVLLKTGQDHRYGYILVNDWTDRSIQILEHDKNNMAYSFSRSKSFPQSLGVGPILALGSASHWPLFQAQLSVNHIQRQILETRHCAITPQSISPDSWDSPISPWVLVPTGTPAGTIFQKPTTIELIKLLMTSAFSVRGAKRRLLDSTKWLQRGDEVGLYSPDLGWSRSTLV